GIGVPASGTSALGRPDPRRSPRPAATINATAIFWSGRRLLRGDRHFACAVAARRDSEKPVDVLLDIVLVEVERVHQLGREHLLRAREHLLFPCREPLLRLADREVAHDLGKLVYVAGLDLVAVVLEPAIP